MSSLMLAFGMRSSAVTELPLWHQVQVLGSNWHKCTYEIITQPIEAPMLVCYKVLLNLCICAGYLHYDITARGHVQMAYINVAVQTGVWHCVIDWAQQRHCASLG